MDEKINGHDAETLVQDEALKELVKRFGDLTVETGADSVEIQQKLGVLQRIITASQEDKDYLQALYQGYFENSEQAKLAADAITERQRYGAPIRPILNRVTSQCAVKGNRVDKAVSGVNSHNIFTNRNAGAPGWKRRSDDKTIA